MKLALLLLLYSSISFCKPSDPGEKDPQIGKDTSPSVSVPTMNFKSNSIAETLSFTENYFDKRIVQRPDVEVNQYLGDLITSIKIPLPKSFHSVKSLDLKYNSSQILNLGYGVGFSLSFPKIYVDKNSGELKILNSDFSGELIPKSNMESMGRRRIEQVCSISGFKCDEVKKDYYLNQSGEDSALYIKMTSGKFIKFAQIKTDGETWIFNESGYPERVVLQKQKGLKLTYEDGILQKLEDLDSKWQAYFSFIEKNNLIRAYNGSFRNAIVGLKKIQVTQGADGLNYDFTYDGEYLISVFEKNSLKRLFQAEYDFPKNSSYELVQENSPIRFQQDSSLSYDADLRNVSWKKNSSDNIEFQVDVNGDFYMDKVIFNQKEVSDTAFAIAKEYTPQRNSGSRTYRPKGSLQELENRLNNISQNISVLIASNENGALIYREDLSLSLPGNAIKYLKFTATEKKRVVESDFGNWDIYEYSIDSILVAIPKFIDLDNNGKKDMLFCDYQDDLTQLSRSINNSNFGGQKQNPVAALYYDLYQNHNINPNAGKGSILATYMIFPDRKKLQSYALQNPDTKIKFPINTSVLKKISIKEGVACNQLSIPIDYNNDGVTDLLTGDQLTLFNDSGLAQKQVLSVDELKKIINPPRTDLEFEKNLVDLIDLKNNGTYDFVSTIGSYVDHNDRSLVFLRDNISYKVKRKSPVKLLIKESTTFGGHAAIDYKYVAGSSLVDSILFNPSTGKSEGKRIQPTFKKSYEYTGSKFNDQFNILMGHSSAQEKIQRESVIASQVVTNYDQDFQNGPIFYLTRARKNGRILKQSTFDENSKWTQIIKNTFGESSDLGQDRVYSYLKNQEKLISGQGQVPLVTQNEISSPVGSIAFLEKNNKSISSYDQIIEESKYSLDLDNFQILQTTKKINDQSGKKLKLDGLYFYNSDAELAQTTLDGITTNFTYDDYGRMKKLADQRGKILEFSYFKNTPLVIGSKQNGSEFHYSYHNITNYLKTSSKDAASEVNYDWSTDEVLLSAEKKGTTLYKLQHVPELRVFKITVGDIERTFYLDGFGRVVQVERLTADGLKIEKQVALSENDQIIKERVPGSESASIETLYDSLGRVVSRDLKGKFRLEGAAFSFKTLTKYEQNGTQSVVEDLTLNIKDYKTFFNNERGDLVGLKSLSENINFFLNPNGQITGIRELGAKYSYDLHNNVASTEGHSTFSPWNKMDQKFSVVENRLDSISGSSIRDEEGQEVLSKNSSVTSPFSQKSSYARGILEKSSNTFNEATLKNEYSYNEEDLLSQVKIGEFIKSFKYDEYNRPVKETISVNKQEYIFENKFLKGQLDSLAPFIAKVSYNEKSAVREIEFENGVRASYEYDVFGKTTYLNWNVGSSNYEINYNTNLEYGEQSKLYNNVEYVGLKQKNKTYQYDNKIYLKKKPRLTMSSKNISFAGSNLIKIENFTFTHENDLLTKINYSGSRSFNNFVLPNKLWQGTCPFNFKTLEECFIKINNNEYLSRGEYIRAIRIADKLTGVLYKEKFYPAITDHLGSLIALVDPDGGKLAFERVYSEWGEKEQVYGDKEFERNIPWAFAGLIQHPFFNGEILQSDTRIYIPSLGLWSSADNLVKWSPNSLAASPGNWDPNLYASGDPVNNIDPSGHIGQTMSADLDGGTAAGGRATALDTFRATSDGGLSPKNTAKIIGDDVGNFTLGFTGVGDAISFSTGRKREFNFSGLNQSKIKLTDTQRKEALKSFLFDKLLDLAIYATAAPLKFAAPLAKEAVFVIKMNKAMLDTVKTINNVNGGIGYNRTDDKLEN